MQRCHSRRLRNPNPYSAAAVQAETFFFTAIPDQDETRLRTRFDKVADYLAGQLNVAVKYVPVKSYAVALGFIVDSAFADIRFDRAVLLIMITACLNIVVDVLSRSIRAHLRLKTTPDQG